MQVTISEAEYGLILAALSTAAVLSRQNGHDEQAKDFSELREKMEFSQYHTFRIDVDVHPEHDHPGLHDIEE